MLVGVAKDLILNPRSVAGGFIYTYKLVNNGEKLEFLHKVSVPCMEWADLSCANIVGGTDQERRKGARKIHIEAH